MTISLFDSHCHLDFEPLLSRHSEYLAEAVEAGVQHFLVPGVHPAGWEGIALLSSDHSLVYPAFGIHPMHADAVNNKSLERLSDISAKAIAIGEIGLDPVYLVAMELQERAFREQLRIAVACDLPVLIHCRRAFQRLLQILLEERADRVGGIMHAYSGSLEMAREFIRLGFGISISGTVTLNNAAKPQRVARELPLEHLLLETDAPEMTPQRYRRRFNRPAWLIETAQYVAALRGVSLEGLARVTTDNARKVLRLGGYPA